MMHSPLMKTAAMLSWVITAIASVNMLTASRGYDLVGYIVNLVPGMEVPLVWIIGIAGVVSLVFFVMTVTMKCHSCGCGPCACNKSGQNGGKCPRCGMSPCTCR